MNKAKQIIIIRTDLKNHQGQKVRTGKLIAQACHASIAFLTNRIKKNMGLTITVKQKNFKNF